MGAAREPVWRGCASRDDAIPGQPVDRDAGRRPHLTGDRMEGARRVSTDSAEHRSVG